MLTPTEFARTELFQNLPLDSLKRLSIFGLPARFPAGSVLIQQGAESDCLYIITKGCVRAETSQASLAQPVALAKFGPGEVAK